MKKLLYVLLATAMAFAMIGCPTDGGDDPPPPYVPPTSDAYLYGLTIAGVNASVGMGADSWDEIGSGGKAELASSQKTNASVIATVASGASVKYVKKGSSDVTAPDFTTVTAAPSHTQNITFADADNLYIEVTSDDGAEVKVYVVGLEIGHNARLANVGISAVSDSTKAAGQNGDAVLGVPNANWSQATIGDFFTDRQPSAGLILRITAEDTDSAITYKLAQESTPPSTAPNDLAAFTPASPQNGVTLATLTVDTSYYLYIKVTATEGDVLYYKTKVILPRKGNIKYGNPQIVDNNGNFHYDTAAWNTAGDDFVINRVNKAETISPYMAEPWGQHTTAVGKALWNDEGIFVYVNVTTKSFKKTETGELQDRPIGYPGTTTDYHMGDSVEVFVNERLQILNAPNDNHGNQFRVGANGVRSGDGSLGNVVNDFFNTGERAVRLKNPSTASGAITGGYEVLMFVPFAGQNETAANDVFENRSVGSGKQVKDGAEIGFELQLNTGITDGARDGILTWNGVTSQAYHNAWGYGDVEMDLDGRTRIFKAEAPAITVQPVGEVYEQDDIATPLSVTASVSDGGTLTYQWYKSAASDGAGTVIDDETDSTYTPPTAAKESWYYYVVVTNTNLNASAGHTVRTVESDRAYVVVGYDAPVAWVDKIKAIDATVPVYGFNIPAGKTFGDYDRVVFKMKFDTYSPVKSARARVFGDFSRVHGSFNAYTNPSTSVNLQNATPGGLLLNGNTNQTWTAEWQEVTCELTGRAGLAVSASLLAADKLILLGIGMFPNNDGGTRVYYLKDIELWSDVSGTLKVSAMYPKHPKMFGGHPDAAKAQGYTNSAANVTTRTLFDDEASVVYETPPPAAPAGATEDFVVDLTKSDATTHNDAWTGNYNNGLIFKLQDSTGTDIDVSYSTGKTYANLTITFKVYDSDKDEITDAIPNSNLQSKFYRTVPGNANGAAVGGQHNNFGASGTYDAIEEYWTYTVPVPADLHYEGSSADFTGGRLAAFGIQSGNAHDVQYIEVLSISLK